MKILCPNHKDTNPSFHIYANGGYCFVCGYTDKTTVDLNNKVEKEDIQQTLEYINALPMDTIRGIQFPRDAYGYYILWPNRSFYKKRLFKQDRIRYMAPKGIPVPLFSYTGDPGWPLAIVEGEINAISLKKAIPEGLNICSPGAITHFNKFMDKYLQYNRIYVIVDKDDAGIAYGASLKETLLQAGKNTSLIALEKDFNDILMECGYDGIKKEIEKQKVGLY